MVKQKHRKKNHRDPIENWAAENCNSSDDSFLTNSGKTCPHITKAINFSNVKKILKNNSLGQCQACVKSTVNSVDLNIETTVVWLCLQCGNQGCDRNSPGQHALVHYRTPHSDSHALVLNVAIWSIWCYICDEEVMPEWNKKLVECVDYLKRNYKAPKLLSDGELSDSELTREAVHVELNDCKMNGDLNNTVSKETSEQAIKPYHRISTTNSTKKNSNKMVSEGKSEITDTKAVGNHSILDSLPKVKGLNNLGNTCFFNAVIQVLSQTHLLCHLFDLHSVKGSTTSLPGTKLELRNKELDTVDSLDLPPLDITVADGGLLTQAFSLFLKEMQSFGKVRTANPGQLFGYLCKRAPQFRGAMQQDSHELLRQLLDAFKNEEIRRYQTGILRAFGLSEKVNPKNVDEETAAKINAYGKLVHHTLIDKIFSGQLISTVLCEECGMSSQVFEPFLDLSLQVTEEKTLRPNSGRRGVESSIVGCRTNVDEKVSKYQEKKAKRQLKREAKLQKNRMKYNKKIFVNLSEEADIKQEVDEPKTTDECDISVEKTGSDRDGYETSDADVEDNVEYDRTSSRQNGPTMVDRIKINDFDINSTLDTAKAENSANNFEETNGRDVINSVGESEELVHKIKNVRIRDEIAINDEIIESMEDHESPKSERNACDGVHEKSSSEEKCDDEPEQQKEIATVEDEAKTKEHNLSVKNEWMMKSLTTLSPRYQPSSHECSVLSCLNQFTASELLTGPNKFGCENCTLLKRKKLPNKISSDGGKKSSTVYTNASKQLLISNPPAILTLHLKRFQQVGSGLSKVNRHVDFPLILDLAPFCTSIALGLPTLKKCQKHVVYSLYGVVEHSGRLSGGHYTAYVKVRPPIDNLQDFLNVKPCSQYDINKLVDEMHCKLPDDVVLIGEPKESTLDSKNSKYETAPSRWYHVSDTHVSEASESAVLKCQAYLLFYERIL